jgi:hypothetical protein
MFLIGCTPEKGDQNVTSENTNIQNTKDKQVSSPGSSAGQTEPTVEKETEETPPTLSKEENKPKEPQTLVLGNLKEIISDGCSCSAMTAEEAKKPNLPKLRMITDLENESPAYLNINGKDIKFKVLKRGKRPADAESKTPYEDIFEADGMIAKIKYVFVKNQCTEAEQCEAADYDVTITVIKDKQIITEKTKGVCGC